MDQSPQSRLSEQKNGPIPERRDGPVLDATAVAGKVDQQLVTLGVSGDANEVMSGLDQQKIQEKDKSVSERKSEPVVRQQVSGQISSAQGTVIKPVVQAVPPTQQQVIHTVRVALRSEVRSLEEKVKKLQKQAQKFTRELADSFQKLRTLKGLLRDLFTFAADFLKMLYDKVMKKESLATVEY